MRWWQNRGLRFKVALGISLTLLLILGSVFYGVSGYIRAQLWQHEVDAINEMNSLVAVSLENAMLNNRWDQVQEMLVKMGQKERTQIDDIAVYNAQSKLVSFASGFPGGRTVQQQSMAEDVTDPTCWACHRLPEKQRPPIMLVTVQGQQVIRGVMPLYNEPRCQSCHGTEKTILGNALVDFRLQYYQQTSSLVTLGLGGGGVVAIVLVILVLYLLLHRTILAPLSELLEVTQAVVQGKMAQQVHVRSHDEIGRLGAAFNSMTTQLRGLISGLEQRVVERTAKVQQRAIQIATGAEISRIASQELHPERLLRTVADLIAERFQLYYAGVFLVDEGGEQAVLHAGTGEAGRTMMERGHKLTVGESSMVGWACAHKQARIALDVGEEAVRFANPLLPLTRSEMALPLRVGDRVIGALDIQSTQAQAFDEDDITALHGMADQIAVALENARLFQQAQSSLQEVERVNRLLTQRGWETFLRSARTDFAEFHQPGVASLTPQEVEKLTQKQRSLTDQDSVVSIPLRARGQVIGMLVVERTADRSEWSATELGLLEEMAVQAAQALESARLYEEPQRLAAREQILGQVTSRMRETLDMQTVLRVAAREMRQALGVPEMTIRLATPKAVTRVEGSPAPQGNGHGESKEARQ